MCVAMNIWHSKKYRHKNYETKMFLELTMQVLSIDPVNIREQSQLNKALLISAQCPIKVYTFLQNEAIQTSKRCLTSGYGHK